MTAQISPLLTRAASDNIKEVEPDFEVDAAKGILKVTIDGKYFDASFWNKATASVIITLNDAVTSISAGAVPAFGVNAVPSFEDGDGFFTYDGVKYNTVVIGNLRWMASNLHYVPYGYTVRSDAKVRSAAKDESIFYPYDLVVELNTETNKYVVTDIVVAGPDDAEKIHERGLFYNIYAALLTDDITAENGKSFEGAQGVCPKGWRIPTRHDWYTLSGAMAKSTYWGDAAKSEDTSVPTWDAAAVKNGYATPSKLNELGFNWYPYGTATSSGNPAPTYASAFIDPKNCVVDEWAYKPSQCNFISSSLEISATKTACNYFNCQWASSATSGKLGVVSTLAGDTGMIVRCGKDV